MTKKMMWGLLLFVLCSGTASAQGSFLNLAYDTASPPIYIDASADPTFSTAYTIESQVIACWQPNQTAIRVIFPEAASVAALTVTVKPNVQILPGCWRGFWGSNVWNARIDHFLFWGDPTHPADAGIVLDGRSNDVVITAAHIFSANVGIWLVDKTEGTHIADSTVIGAVYGLYVATNAGFPGLFVHDNHFNTSYRGIMLQNHEQSFVSNNLIYRGSFPYGAPLQPNYIGIDVEAGARDTILSANLVMCGAYVPTTKAVYIHPTVMSVTSAAQTMSKYCGSNGATSAVSVNTVK